MATVVATELDFHEGEKEMHMLMRVPERDNPTTPYLSPGAGMLVMTTPILALGTTDPEGRIWSTIWGGEEGFARPIAQSVIGVRALVDRLYDPVLETLVGTTANNEVIKADGPGKMVSALAINLSNRKRAKIFGRMMLGTLNDLEEHTTPEEKDGERAQVQLVVHVDESLGQCPKYINKKQITPTIPKPKLISDSPRLPQEAIDLLNHADLFFVSSSNGETMDTNNRGGFPGFLRLLSNEPSGAVLVYPEYSGNRLYQTLGNLRKNPRAGYVIPDFKTGDCLYVSGTTEVLFGKDAEDLLPRSNLVVKVTVLAARFVEKSLAFRGIEGEPSPYNPPIRFLRSEKEPPTANLSTGETNTATLIKKESLSPSISRFRFRLSRPEKINAGQYAVFSFRDELDIGYSHMRDDDPTSINDDYIRTFTVSSGSGKDLPGNEFEITARKHGNVTTHLFRSHERSGLEVPMLGFGGSFRIEDQPGTGIIPFVAGGIGITPVLAQLAQLDLSRFRLFWTIAIDDIGLVQDTFERFPGSAKVTNLFITQVSTNSSPMDIKTLEKIESSDATVHRRRLAQADLDVAAAETWYLCSGTGVKTAVLNWLTGKKVIYEDFSY